MELIQTLQRADKSFELQIGPDRGHSAIDTDRMLEFFLIGTVFSLGGSGRSSIE
jgi:dipeptidyl-peptidase-4